jgi:hypothetical protein
MPENAPAPDTQAEAFLHQLESAGVTVSVNGEQIFVKRSGWMPAWVEKELSDPARYSAVHGIVAERQRLEADQERRERTQSALNDAMAQYQYGNGGTFGGPALPFELDQVEREVKRRTAAIAAELKRRGKAKK